MNTNQLIGLEACEAEAILQRQNASFKFVYCTDRKQQKYDKELVTAVRTGEDGVLTLIVCRYLFNVQ